MMKELNLLPQSYASHKKIVKQKKKIATGTLIGGVVVLGVTGFIFGQETYLNIKKSKLQNEISTSRELVAKNEKLVNDIALTKQHIEKAETLKGIKNKDTDGVINELSKLFHGDVKIGTLNYQNNASSDNGNVIATINMSGTAKSKGDIENFWANLREHEQFKDSHIASITEGKDGYAFTIDLSVKGVVKDGSEDK